MKRLTLSLAALGLASSLGAFAEDSDEQKSMYVLGYSLANALAPFEVTEEEQAFVLQGLQDALNGVDAKHDIKEYQAGLVKRRQEKTQVRMERESKLEKEAAASFLKLAEQRAGAEKTSSGLIYIETLAGSGNKPKRSDRVQVHYSGTLRDGTVFDSSYSRGEPATFSLGGVIACWTEGLQKMRVGGKATLVCPAEIAYGERGSPPRIPGGAALEFDVELVDIVNTP